MHKKKSTPQIILDAARELFNTDGAVSTTTNHIAKKCSMSPGNLYYHFRNKEHIFLDLLTEMIEAFDDIFLPSVDFKNMEVENLFLKTCEIIYNYRFIYSDLSYLVSFDENFRIRYQSIKDKRIKDGKSILRDFAQKGIIHNLPANEDLNILINFIWIYIEGIITSLKIEGEKITLTSIQSALKHIAVPLKPYLNI